MRKKSQLLLLAAAVLGVAVLSVTPVFAEDSNTGSDDNSTTATVDGENSSVHETTNPNSLGETDIESFRTDARDKLKTLRENVKEHSQEARMKACEARQASINRRAGNFSDAAQRHLDVFTGIYTKVQAFYVNNKLSVADYDALVVAVNSKQTVAQQAVDALKSLDVSIDCTAPDPAQQLETLKTAVSSVRSALQAYRVSIKDLVIAIQGVSSAKEDSTGGGQ